jgi:hypothetical protein
MHPYSQAAGSGTGRWLLGNRARWVQRVAVAQSPTLPQMLDRLVGRIRDQANDPVGINAEQGVVHRVPPELAREPPPVEAVCVQLDPFESARGRHRPSCERSHCRGSHADQDRLPRDPQLSPFLWCPSRDRLFKTPHWYARGSTRLGAANLGRD